MYHESSSVIGMPIERSRTFSDLEATAGRVKVFQSSFVGSAPEIGTILTEELGQELYHAELVFLICTIADENWSYCMWECGVAFNPRKDDTRIVVLQCGQDVPVPLNDRVRGALNDEMSIKVFVKQFLTDEIFFLGCGGRSRILSRRAKM